MQVLFQAWMASSYGINVRDIVYIFALNNQIKLTCQIDSPNFYIIRQTIWLLLSLD